MTNGDKIRQMSNDELSEYMCVNHMCDYCPAESETCDSCAIDAAERCKNSWLNWLNKKARGEA